MMTSSKQKKFAFRYKGKLVLHFQSQSVYDVVKEQAQISFLFQKKSFLFEKKTPVHKVDMS